MIIDEEHETYILYDLNRGYYQWPNLDSFLAGIQKRLEREQYLDVELLPVTMLRGK